MGDITTPDHRTPLERQAAASQHWHTSYLASQRALGEAQAVADALRARLERVEAALQRCVDLLDAAGVHNLMRGVQLGQISWAVKMNDAVDAARAARQDPRP